MRDNGKDLQSLYGTEAQVNLGGRIRQDFLNQIDIIERISKTIVLTPPLMLSLERLRIVRDILYKERNATILIETRQNIIFYGKAYNVDISRIVYACLFE